VLTDWQWRVKWALGERELPSSYIEYLLRSLWPEDIEDALVSNVTAVVFIVVTIASMVRFRAFRRQAKTREHWQVLGFVCRWNFGAWLIRFMRQNSLK
jgi:hypothetical protein